MGTNGARMGHEWGGEGNEGNEAHGVFLVCGGFPGSVSLATTDGGAGWRGRGSVEEGF